MCFIIVNGNPQRAILRQQLPDNFQTVAHESQPNGMLQSVIVMGKGAAGIVWRINKNAFYLAAKFLFQCFQRQQVVAKDEAIIENIVIADAVFGVVGLFRIFQQNPWL